MANNTTNQDSALEVLKTKLLEGGDMVSSEETGFEEAIGEIRTSLTEAQEKAEAGIEAGFERQKIETVEVGARRRTSQLEARRGFATNTALFKQLDEQTEKSIRDLELRKTEALASGQTELATQLANLQLKEIEFKTTQRQQVFTNLLSLAGLGFEEERVGFEKERLGFEAERLGFERETIEIAREELTLQERQVSIAEARQKQEERIVVSDIALKFGLEISESDTLDTMIAKAQPFASAQQKMDMEKQKAELANIKASTQKMLEEGTAMDETTLNILAEAANISTAVLGSVKNPEDQARIILRAEELNKARSFETKELEEIAQREYNSETPFNEALLVVRGDPRITNKDEAERVVREIYDRPEIEGSFWERLKEEFIEKTKKFETKSLQKRLEELRK